MKAKKMEYKPTNCVVLNVGKNFFKVWLEFLAPLHGLTNKEIDIAAEFLVKRHEISKSCSDNELIDKLLFSVEKKEEIRKKFDMTKTYFYTVITKFKQRNFIMNGRINPKFIPKSGTDKNIYQLLVVFDTKEDDK